MKRIIAILLALFLPLTALASTDMDSITTEELLALQRKITLELQARDADLKLLLAYSTYIVGDSIPAGDYYFLSIHGDYSSSSIRHWSDPKKTTCYCTHTLDPYTAAFCKITLKENELLDITGNSVVMCSQFPAFPEHDADATFIPMGSYIVGEHIPAGTYRCMTDSLSTVELFNNPNLPLSPYEEYELNYLYPETIITLKEGKLLTIGHSPIYMKKENGQLFFK